MIDASASPRVRRVLRILLNRHVVFLLVLYLYALAMDYRGGIQSHAFFSQWIELLFLLYFYSYFYRILQPGRWRTVLAAVPILVGYLIQDIYFLVYGKVFHLIAVLELPELLQVIPLGYGAIMVVFVILPMTLFLLAVNYRRYKTVLLGALPVGMLIGLIMVSPSAYTDFINRAGNGIVQYSDAKSVESNGRYTMLFYREAERQNALAATLPYHNRVSYEQAIAARANRLQKNANHKNVHLIVLESFLDPRLFELARFSKDPAHPDFEKLFGKNLGFSVSPVFGGASAQAEFEVLCGVPALDQLSSVEFNVFTGTPAYCLPGVLGKIGYRTIASNAYKPSFFNAPLAYQGIGFAEAYFPREYSGVSNTYLSTGDVQTEHFMFDEVLFDQNLAFVKKHLQSGSHAPLFNYMMTIYGHTPHTLDPVRRPEVLQVLSGNGDAELQRAANQFYYRTRAIAHYVNALIRMDRNSLIILVSDHVPPLQYGPDTYHELHYLGNAENADYLNRLMIIENGHPVVYRTMRHFDIPDVVLNFITGGKHCREQSCGFLQKERNLNRWAFLDRYYTLMAHAAE